MGYNSKMANKWEIQSFVTRQPRNDGVCLALNGFLRWLERFAGLGLFFLLFFLTDARNG
jgi:hypothetical protein